MKAMAFPASNELPPPIIIIPSLLVELNLATPSETFLPVGLLFIFENTENST